MTVWTTKEVEIFYKKIPIHYTLGNINDSTENACKLIMFLCSDASKDISGKLISAEWDNWEIWPEHINELVNSDLYTLRRVTGKDRNFILGDI
jgi:hypothetical protein